MIKICPICNKEFEVATKHKNQIYCSKECFGKSRRINIIGKQFGKLTVIKQVEHASKDLYYLCKCECGNEKIIRGSHLTSGKILSCGCWQKQRISETHKKHGMCNTRLYEIYKGMLKRCYNTTSEAYKNYGARGIVICDEWKNDFKVFYDWATSNGYKDNLTIDRINNDGNYEPSNCRWVTKLIQSRNTRRNHYVTYNNETHCLSEWSEILGISYKKLLRRFNRDKHNWTVERAFKTP